MTVLVVVAIIVGSIIGAILSMPDVLGIRQNSDGMKTFLGFLALAAIILTIWTLGGWVAIVFAGAFGLLFGIIYGSAMGR